MAAPRHAGIAVRRSRPVGLQETPTSPKRRRAPRPPLAPVASEAKVEIESSVVGGPEAVVVCAASELYVLKKEIDSSCLGLPNLRVVALCATMPTWRSREMLHRYSPHVVVGTPSCIRALVREGAIREDVESQRFDAFLSGRSSGTDLSQHLRSVLHGRGISLHDTASTVQDHSPSDGGPSVPGGAAPTRDSGAPEEEEKLTDFHDARVRFEGITQCCQQAPQRQKAQALADLLDMLNFNQAVVIVNSSPSAVALSWSLIDQGYPAMAVHSGLEQVSRSSQFARFGNFEKRIMVLAEDVINDGVAENFNRVDLLLNVDAPESDTAYISRVERCLVHSPLHRTSREQATVVTLVSSEIEEAFVTSLGDRLGTRIEKLPPCRPTHSV